MTTMISGNGSFSFIVEVSGDDLVCRYCKATWFGGVNDPSDSGRTASGVSTRDNPSLLGCALPMNGFGTNKTDGSPIPKLPWKTPVQVTNLATNVTRTFPLIDLGPSKFAPSHAAIDLTEAAFQALGGDPKAGVIRVNFLIPGGAHYLQQIPFDSVSLLSSEELKNSAFQLTSSDMSHGISHGLQKPPIKEFIASPNFSSRNGIAIEMIVMHYTDGPTAQGAINRFLDPNEQVSAHYIIDRNGDIYQMVQDTDKAWHAKAANSMSIGIEHAAMPGQQMTPAQENSSVGLVRWLMATYNIDPSKVVGHRFAPGNVGTTDCPDHLFGDATEQAVTNWVTNHFSPAPMIAALGQDA